MQIKLKFGNNMKKKSETWRVRSGIQGPCKVTGLMRNLSCAGIFTVAPATLHAPFHAATSAWFINIINNLIILAIKTHFVFKFLACLYKFIYLWIIRNSITLGTKRQNVKHAPLRTIIRRRGWCWTWRMWPSTVAIATVTIFMIVTFVKIFLPCFHRNGREGDKDNHQQGEEKE